MAEIHPRRSGDLNGINTRFKPGHRTWNKGLKGVVTGGVETQFKKGHVPPNIVPVGTVVAATKGYFKIKVAEPNKWRWLHRKIWEDAHGPIQKGMVLIFKDGQWRNCVLENLALISLKENMSRNSICNYPRELISAIKMAAKLKRIIDEK